MKRIDLKKIHAFFSRNQDPEKVSKIIIITQYILKRIKIIFLLRVAGLEYVKNRYSKLHEESWVILHYQRIIDPTRIPIPISQASFVTPETFTMHCNVLSQYAKVISLQKLCAILDKGQEPEPGTVVLTFDGGFNDFLLHATKPLLEHSLHATIAIKTAFIESKAFLLSDQIAASMMLFTSTGTPLKPLEHVPEQMNQNIEQTLDNGIPTKKTIQTCMAILLGSDPRTKALFLSSLGAQLKKLEVDIPDWQDFLRWQDVSYLSNLGFSFADYLHSEVILPPLSYETIQKELSESQKLFEVHGIPYTKILSLPYGLYSPQNIIDLTKEEIRYCLGNTLSPYLREQEQIYTKILKRISICEGNAQTKDLFLNQIWDIS